MSNYNKEFYPHSRKRKSRAPLIAIIVILLIIIIALVFVIIKGMSVAGETANGSVSKITNESDVKDSLNNVSVPKNINSVKVITDYDPDTVVDVMDTVKFGSYPQNDTSGNSKDPIEWIVLDRQGNKALLLSKYILDCKSYNNEHKEVTWETCDLRKWLNNDFYNKAFDGDEKKLVKTTDVINSDSVQYGTSGGNPTNDNVFCLSIDELRKYFGKGYDETDGYRMERNVTTKGTEYAKNVDNNGSKLWVISEEEWYQGNSDYWLRSPGYFQNCSSCVTETGFLDISNLFQGVAYNEYGVRPAIWIEW